ncbi:TolC family protein [Thalassobacter stenotrophicus]|uniref:Outer membrane efflux protein n=2 Tax=Thalassobacter stenotrophicus TaxID=266809 RepID=A0A0P1F0W1_9RHOB|nr:TolC family protein [Thalassobacter stenotrophicus]PVZ48415.1 TolC family protein [Thalassobacter stenotrophicus]CUH61220.1 Outer membrane efflux protein [Thalassobacter stenotrophicus]SHI59938.1 Outer membrane protein TolC [Thalassobacter stenotrophicus DSM 16310]
MSGKYMAAAAALAFVAGCTGEGSIGLSPGDVPGIRAMNPSVGEELDANRDGVFMNASQARTRLDSFPGNGEFDLSSEDLSNGQWPVDTITYKAFRNTSDRAIYIRRALGRYALIEARERGLGTSLNGVRRVAHISAPSTAGEWWVRSAHRGDLLPRQRAQKISLPDIINATVRNSFQIAAFGDLPAIRGTAIQEARGRFVPEIFADASIERRDEFATSPASAGGATRLTTDEDDVEFGVRSRLQTGGEISLSQRFTTTDTNDTAFIPGEQTVSQTALTYVQPLLRGGGFTYTDSTRRIANMDTQIAVEEFHRQASAHLLEVERAYWNLYVARSVYAQRRHLAGHGAQIAEQIGNREGIDADPVLINRARSLASQWRADMVRAKAAMENAEFRLAALVNDKRLGPADVEVLPTSAPNGALHLLSTNDTIEAVFIHRPEIQQAILQYEAALLREGMAANESLPELDLVLEARSEGGTGGRSLGDAFDDQSGNVGTLVGLKFSVPLGFDERDARYHRRRIETVQQERQVMSAISTVLLEVDVSANEYIVACNDLVAQRRALEAAQADTNAIQARWDEGIGDAGIELLSALLTSYQNLQASEQAVATARATREISAANLARARGLLLDRWGLSMNLTRDIRGEQTYQLARSGRDG